MGGSTFKCCIFIPAYCSNWSHSEKAAVQRCMRILCDFDFVFVHKKSSPTSDIRANILFPLNLVKSFEFIAIDDKWLSSVANYNQMMLSPWFYKIFRAWEYMLVFQLDAWIIKGNLNEWLSHEFTFIGAPLCRITGDNFDSAILSIGNGGLSLRRVQHMLKILTSLKYRLFPVYSSHDANDIASLRYEHSAHPLLAQSNANDPAIKDSFLRTSKLRFKNTFRHFGFFNNLLYFSKYGFHEDIIFGHLAPKVYEWIKIPNYQQAVGFSLDAYPKELVRAFPGIKPFGCHAWEKWGREFYLTHFSDEFSSLLN